MTRWTEPMEATLARKFSEAHRIEDERNRAIARDEFDYRVDKVVEAVQSLQQQQSSSIDYSDIGRKSRHEKSMPVSELIRVVNTECACTSEPSTLVDGVSIIFSMVGNDIFTRQDIFEYLAISD